MKPIICLFLLLNILPFSCPEPVWAQTEKTFPTDYTTLYYLKDKDLSDFIWKLGGERLDFVDKPQLASYRVDRIVDRVQAILDMRPPQLHLDIYLRRGTLKEEKVAFYEYESGSIFASVDYVSDGVLAHEIAHAVINRYFGSAPPSKAQEILAQYVDKHLWNDY